MNWSIAEVYSQLSISKKNKNKNGIPFETSQVLGGIWCTFVAPTIHLLIKKNKGSSGLKAAYSTRNGVPTRWEDRAFQSSHIYAKGERSGPSSATPRPLYSQTQYNSCHVLWFGGWRHLPPPPSSPIPCTTLYGSIKIWYLQNTLCQVTSLVQSRVTP